MCCAQEMTFNVDGISLLEHGETPDEALAKELGTMQSSQPTSRPNLQSISVHLSPPFPSPPLLYAACSASDRGGFALKVQHENTAFCFFFMDGE